MLCWGVRDMKRYQLLKVDSPLVELECGGTVLQSKYIKDASKNPNFPEPIVTIDVVRTSYSVMSLCLMWCNCVSVHQHDVMVMSQTHIRECQDFCGFFLHTCTQYLPKEELYAPPLNIRILDKRSFGRMPLVGTHIIKSLKDFHVEPVLSAEQRAAVQGGEEGGEEGGERKDF